MNTKICTSVEQSKKLIELGIDTSSADMYWNASSDNGENYSEFPTCELATQWDIPAWSLSALLELIPERIPGTKLVIKWDRSYYIEGRDCLFDTAIDAAFEMIIWLKENGKI